MRSGQLGSGAPSAAWYVAASRDGVLLDAARGVATPDDGPKWLWFVLRDSRGGTTAQVMQIVVR
ncbi:MAG: hypothetical protein AB7P03_01225 [Kofleriaceae bacterium]